MSEFPGNFWGNLNIIKLNPGSIPETRPLCWTKCLEKTRLSKNKYWTWWPLNLKSPGHDNFNLIFFVVEKMLIVTLNSSFEHFWDIVKSYCPWKIAKFIQNRQYFSLANIYLLFFCLTLHIQILLIHAFFSLKHIISYVAVPERSSSAFYTI